MITTQITENQADLKILNRSLTLFINNQQTKLTELRRSNPQLKNIINNIEKDIDNAKELNNKVESKLI